MRNQFRDACAVYIDRTIYTLGGQGENVCAKKAAGVIDPEGWIRSKTNSTAHATAAVKLYRAKVAAGINPVLTVDCSGYVIEVLKRLGLVSANFDRTAKQLYALCDSHPAREELRLGDLVCHSKTGKPEDIHHIGFYMGEDKVSESRGHAYGVVEKDFDDKPADWKEPWNFYGRIDKLLPFTVDEPEPEPPKVPFRFELVSPRLKGAEVLALQEFLRSTGYTDYDGRPLEPDGTFGPRTDSALARFASAYAAAPAPIVPHSVTISTKPFAVVIDGEEVQIK